MAPGDVVPVPDCAAHYVDTGMYDTAGYGSVYVLDADRPAVVDSGIGAHTDRILAALDEVGVAREDLAAVALTHVHLDHAGGAGFLAAACPNADVYVHERGAPHVVDPSRLVAGTREAVGDQWQFYVEPEPVPEDRVVELADGDAVDLGSRELLARACPGHAPHQVVFADSRSGAVFTADAAGIWVPDLGEVRETTPPPQFDFERCLADVETVRGLDPERLLYAHFGPSPPDRGPDELLDRYDRRLREWVATVRETRARHDSDEATVTALADDPEAASVWGETKARAERAMNVRGVLASA
jgi:glyoxylase-like metal-dependent hydrolase (beta-lactamase superfamily II)